LQNVTNDDLAAFFQSATISGVYERRLNAWWQGIDDEFGNKFASYLGEGHGAAQTGDVPDSREKAVLLSLSYNSKDNTASQPGLSLLGQKLRDAVILGDRAEAWYEIRYNSDADHQQAKRRYIESHIFGLYSEINDDYVPTDSESLKALRTFTKHESKILNYDYDNRAKIALAPGDLAAIAGLLGQNQDLGTVGERHDALQPAFEHLQTWYSGLRSSLASSLALADFDGSAFSKDAVHNVFVAPTIGAGGNETAPHTVDRESGPHVSSPTRQETNCLRSLATSEKFELKAFGHVPYDIRTMIITKSA
jgi:hypothetical protein